MHSVNEGIRVFKILQLHEHYVLWDLSITHFSSCSPHILSSRLRHVCFSLQVPSQNILNLLLLIDFEVDREHLACKRFKNGRHCIGEICMVCFSFEKLEFFGANRYALMVILIPIQKLRIVFPGEQNLLSRFFIMETDVCFDPTMDPSLEQEADDFCQIQMLQTTVLVLLLLIVVLDETSDRTARESGIPHSRIYAPHPNLLVKSAQHFNHADVTKPSPCRISVDILPVFHVHLALLILYKHCFFAFLLVVFSLFEVDALCRVGSSLNPGLKLNCKVKHLGMVFKI